MRSRLTLCFCALMGFAWYALHGGWATLNPSHTGWLRSEDLSQHFMGWLYFRRAPWTFPLGQLPALGHPVGTTLGFMDANPLMSSVFRLWSPILPLFWQFQGLWLASCFALQGLWGAMLARLCSPKTSAQILMAALFIMAPPALLRVCHENLAAQWLLLAGLYALMRPDLNLKEAKQTTLGGALLLGVALGAHAYLAAMLIPLLVLGVLRRAVGERSMTRTWACLSLGLLAGVTGVILYSYGFIGSGISQAEPGFGSQSADLTTLINPMGWSRWLPNQPIQIVQFEGYGYLGLGGMVLAVFALYGSLRQKLRPAPPWAWPLLTLLCLGYVALALSDTITWRGTVVLNLRPWTTPLLPIISIFRASGRFIWAPYYALMLAGMSALCRLCPGPRGTWILAGIVALQLADIRPAEQDVHTKLTRNEPSPYQDTAWNLMDGAYAHLAMVPPMFPSSQLACRWQYPWGYQVPFGFLAYGHNMSINSVYAGRANVPKIDSYCHAFWQQLENFQLDTHTVYVVAPHIMPLFEDPRMQATCGRVDGVHVCVANTRRTAWSDYLRKQSSASL
jgi:hypothetical protein